jgi:tRNA pseudouridine32 synthase / 23S rRNA pseudouridine746 synthase
VPGAARVPRRWILTATRIGSTGPRNNRRVSLTPSGVRWDTAGAPPVRLHASRFAIDPQACRVGTLRSMSGSPPAPLVTYFEPVVRVASRADVPAFTVAEGTPHPLAMRAAEALWAALAAAPPREAGGKMFGVLVVADAEGRVGYTCAFSGMLDGDWRRPGFVPPPFDAAMRDSFWPAGEADLAVIAAEIDAARADPEGQAQRRAFDELSRSHAAELAALLELHRRRRAARAAARAALAGTRNDAGRAASRAALAATRDAATRAATHALDQASRGDAAERRRVEAAHAAAIAALASQVAARDRALAVLEQRRADRSRQLLLQLHDSYVLPSARGERRQLSELFAPAMPPGGAGDCAAPKLLAHAFTHGLVPIALAERWWGPPALSGDRVAGRFYPPCRGKCGPILAHMLDGLAREPGPRFGGAPVAPDEPRAVFEDDWLVVVDKPCDLLSVPGRTPELADSVLTRLRRRYPHATGPLLVHRLDLQTSGLLVAAKDAATHADLQRQFAARLVDKRYAAWLDGAPAGERGVVELALRVDLDDRPRQIVDPVHGKPARTEWRVVERRAGRTRMVLVPRTGRTHQLRVHAAHPAGLGAAIVGDALYGRPDDRLLLHAEALRFVHPRTGRPVIVRSPAPF